MFSRLCGLCFNLVVMTIINMITTYLRVTMDQDIYMFLNGTDRKKRKVAQNTKRL